MLTSLRDPRSGAQLLIATILDVSPYIFLGLLRWCCASNWSLILASRELEWYFSELHLLCATLRMLTADFTRYLPYMHSSLQTHPFLLCFTHDQNEPGTKDCIHSSLRMYLVVLVPSGNNLLTSAHWQTVLAILVATKTSSSPGMAHLRTHKLVSISSCMHPHAVSNSSSTIPRRANDRSRDRAPPWLQQNRQNLSIRSVPDHWFSVTKQLFSGISLPPCYTILILDRFLLLRHHA